MNRSNAATPAFYINTQGFSANNISTNLLCVNPESFLRASLSFSNIYLSSGVSCSLVAVVLVFIFAFSEAFSQCWLFALHVVRHIFEICDDSRMRITTKTVHDRNDDFALRYVRIYPGVSSRAELVTLA